MTKLKDIGRHIGMNFLIVTRKGQVSIKGIPNRTTENEFRNKEDQNTRNDNLEIGNEWRLRA